MSYLQTELSKTFSRVLDEIVAGKLTECPDDTGLDRETVTMLNTLAALPIPKRARDVHAVRVEFGQIVNGLPRNGVQDIGKS
jgi:hypothetical protein